MALSDYQLEILKMLKNLGVPKEEAVLAMISVQDNRRAKMVLDKVKEMEKNKEKITGYKLLKIMATL